MIIKTGTLLIERKGIGPDITFNIKTKNDVRIMYTLLYYYASSLFTDNNICDVVDGVCRRKQLRCGDNFCCTCPTCEYLGPNGCTVVMALGCKLWVCTSVAEEHINAGKRAGEAVKELQHLKDIFQAIGLVSFRKHLEQDIEGFWQAGFAKTRRRDDIDW